MANNIGGLAMPLDAKFFEQWKEVLTIAAEQKVSTEVIVNIQQSFLQKQELAQAQLAEDKEKIDKVLDDPDSKDLTLKDVIVKAGANSTTTTRAYVYNSRNARKKLVTNGK
jgi:hypothetical protein